MTQIGNIRSDRGGEFINKLFNNFCGQEGIRHQLLALRTPKQNGVIEKKNRSLVEMRRALHNDQGLLHKFWAETIITFCYIYNKYLVRLITGNTMVQFLISTHRNLRCLAIFHSNFFHKFFSRLAWLKKILFLSCMIWRSRKKFNLHIMFISNSFFIWVANCLHNILFFYSNTISSSYSWTIINLFFHLLWRVLYQDYHF